jgi:polysaccharide chain length determinant protein (PEP-CTERM system associated)
MEHEKNIRIEDVIKIIKRRRRGISISVFAVLMLTVLVILVWDPVYRSTSTILIEEQEIPREYVTPTISSYADQRLQAINQRIMSAARLLELVNRFDLYADKRKRFSTEEIIDDMRVKDIKFETVTADVVDSRTGRPTTATIAFTVSYEGKNPVIIQQVANALASLYLEENSRIIDEQSTGATKFLETEMNSVKATLAELEKRIAAYKEKNPYALPELLQFNLQTLDWSERNYDQLKDNLRALQEKESYLKSKLSSMAPDAVNQDKERLKELRVMLGSLKARYSEEYPDVIKTKKEIEQLEKKLQSQLNRPKDIMDKPDNPSYISLDAELVSVQSEVSSVKQQIEDLDKKRETYRKRLEMAPRVSEGYMNLLVERNNTQSKYDDLMKKYMEARVSHGLEKEQMGTRFTLIDPAKLPEKPVRPNRPIILLFGLIIGIFAGVGTASLQEVTDHSARSSEDLATSFPFPVLAEIPEIVTLEEELRRRKLFKIIAGGSVVLLVVSIVVVHFFIMDMDVLWARVVRRLFR